MKKLILALVLTGCGSEPFSSTMFHDGDAPDAGGDVVDAPRGTGGAPSSGGASSGGSGTGGRVVGMGGHMAGTGGVGAGGVQAAGGTQATGGVLLTGGAPGTGGVSTGGAPVVDAGCALFTHDNGAGQTWTDCVPLGTYDSNQARKACEAWCDANNCVGACFDSSVCGAEYMLGQVGVAGSDVVLTGWSWKAPSAGSAVKVNSGQTSCPAVGTWN